MVRYWVLSVLLVGRVAMGQLVLDEAAVRKNLVHEVAPVVPAGGKMAVRASGRVVLLVEIGADGRVTAARADQGPSMLREPAVDAVKQWRFRPFTAHGDKVAVHTKLTVMVGGEVPVPGKTAAGAALAKAEREEVRAESPVVAKQEDPGAREYATLADRCHRLVLEHADAAAEAKACRAAAGVAARFPAGTRTVERRSAYVYAATALMRTDELKDAVAFGSRAIAVVKEGHDDESGASAAYTVRGQAEAFAGDLAGADRDLTIAEKYERKALSQEAGKELEPGYKAAMKGLLLFHAKVLDGLKRGEDAAAKAAEAKTL